MKHLVLATSVVLFFACKSSTDENANASDTSKHSETNHHASSDSSTGNNAMMDMHNAMYGMMEQTKSMKPTGDADYDFAMMMKHHHEGAVKMAQAELSGGTDADLKSKAQKIIDDQQKEITVFDQYLNSTKPSGKSDFGKNAMSMMTDMGSMNMESSSIDAMFLSMMIPHHQDAIKMSQEYLKAGKDAKIRAIASNIIKSQQREIKEFQEWLDKNKK